MEKDDMKYPPKSVFVCNWKVHVVDCIHNPKKSMSSAFRELIWGISDIYEF
ncbi:hypothetical protein ACFL6I_13220 [candidate division KSB1 bacterium]